MTTVLKNKYAETGFPNDPILLDPKMIVRTDVEAVKVVVDACLKPEKSPLIKSNLAENIGIHSLWFKDERNRMNMGSFKAIGATYVLAREASEKVGLNASEDDLKKSLEGRTYVTASAGNHGLSLANGARLFGAKAIIYLSKTVPTEFAEFIKTYGADVVVAGKNYEASMAAAAEAATQNNWTLLSDSTWENYSAGIDVTEFVHSVAPPKLKLLSELV